MQHPVCTDDYGRSVYVSHLSAKPVHADNAVLIGACVPGVTAKYVIGRDELALHKQSVQWFHESEQNCNTCRHLQRKPHEKRKDGQLLGVCGQDGKELLFHPSDPMHHTCYQSRYSTPTHHRS